MEEEGILETFFNTDIQTIVFVILELIVFGFALYFSKRA